MSDRYAFRPAITSLGGRVLLSAWAPDSAAIAPQAAVIVPTPGDPVIWMALHGEYAAQAARGGENVVFLGDSITRLWTGEHFTPLTAKFQGMYGAPRGTQAWDAMIAPLGAINFGIPGDQTENLLWRVQHGEMAGRPKVAVVLIGINDLLKGKTPAQTVAGVIADVDAIRSESPGSKVLLVGILPNAEVMTEVVQANALLGRWAVAHRVTFVNIDPQMTGYIDSTGHPVAAGYQVFAASIQGPLRRLLGVSV